MGARLKFWRRSRVPKKGSRDEAVFLAASPLVTAPPSNLTRIYYNGSAAKSHSTTTQYRQLRMLWGSRPPTLRKIGSEKISVLTSVYDQPPVQTLGVGVKTLNWVGKGIPDVYLAFLGATNGATRAENRD